MEKKTRRKFSPEFKEDAVKLVTEQGYSIVEAVRSLGIHANILGRRTLGDTADGGSVYSAGGSYGGMGDFHTTVKAPPMRFTAITATRRSSAAAAPVIRAADYYVLWLIIWYWTGK